MLALIIVNVCRAYIEIQLAEKLLTNSPRFCSGALAFGLEHF